MGVYGFVALALLFCGLVGYWTMMDWIGFPADRDRYPIGTCPYCGESLRGND